MAKKNTPEAVAAVPSPKRTPEEKAQRKADKAGRHATKSLTEDRAEKKASQKQTLKAAAKQLQKELDGRMSEVVTRIRKETKAKLKEVVKEATRRLDVDTERMFEQALHTIVRHYDSIAPGRTTDIHLPAPTGDNATEDAENKSQTLNKGGLPRKAQATSAAGEDEETAPKKRAGRPVGSGTKASSPAPAAGTGRGPGRPKRQPAAEADPALSTDEATTNDSVAVDNV